MSSSDLERGARGASHRPTDRRTRALHHRAQRFAWASQGARRKRTKAASYVPALVHVGKLLEEVGAVCPALRERRVVSKCSQFPSAKAGAACF